MRKICKICKPVYLLRRRQLQGQRTHSQRALHSDGGPLRRAGDPLVYSDDEVEFMLFLDRKKRQTEIWHPDWPTVLAWAKEFGYRKVAP